MGSDDESKSSPASMNGTISLLMPRFVLELEPPPTATIHDLAHPHRARIAAGGRQSYGWWRTSEKESPVNQRPYIKPPWMQRHFGNRMSVLFRPSMISKLAVRGRRSGRWHTTPVVVLEHNGERYLVSYRGASDWARNLEASHTARLTQRDHREDIEVVDVPVAKRAELLRSYADRYGKMPTVASVLRALPDPGDHPVFRITASRPANASADMR
jgi:deazaflavin-dependent oxidoreductase (nitroreductase family)